MTLSTKMMMNTTLLFLNAIGPEMILVFFAILLLFGGKKIPELMRGIGKGIREFNTAKGSLEKELKDGMKEEEQREKDARELRELREREARRQREESFITRDND
ncbi:twin-arginine translocase TatA/TatE family subunit [Lewinella sp. JB7]|uniref:Sec-independent protein translocase subunit TatA/TatB n=1 Tax=Lewinella sp. JB7 TaxID=2962887 RepID=UPI0020C9D3ED|nr:twin-arginine translocase TatA/TatE family subunit [Lewinella sp. JB7]